MRHAVGARLAALTFLALSFAALADGAAALSPAAQPAAAASASSAGAAGSAGGRAAAGAPVPAVVIEITSVTPGTAGPGSQVTVSGYLTNTTGQAMSGLSVQLWSDSTRLPSRDAMTSYLNSAGPSWDQPVSGAQTSVPVTVAAHATRHWSISLRASQAGWSGFGVYPLAAQVNQAGLQLDAARTFEVFWPGKSERSVLRPIRVAWVWPLIATPQQAACRSLLSDTLPASVSGSGRLGRLLTAGGGATGSGARLTWAIDPALLRALSAIARPYRVAGSATCAGGAARPASAAARDWLARLRATTAHQDFFVTPYADVDTAALAHQGLDNELASAFSDGRAAARSLLGRDQRPGGIPAAGGTATAGAASASGGTISDQSSRRQPGGIAWPAEGLADYGVLGSLAVNHVGTVLLDSSTMPPAVSVPYTPTAVTSTPDGVGSQLHVLLADHTISQVLASGPTGAQPSRQVPAGPAADAAAAAAFSTEQRFLAETAMIAAESPSTPRAVVIAPPRRWDPAPGLAGALLTETTTAPWLRPASVASLAASKPGTGQVPRQPPAQTRVSPDELPGSLLRQVERLTAHAGLQGSMLTPRQPGYLSTAIAAAESSAWRGNGDGHRPAQDLLHGISSYLAAQQRAVRIIDPPRVTLGGKSGSVPVSVSNHLRRAVTVGLKVSAPSTGRIVIGNFPRLITVAAGTQKTIKIPVRAAAAGSTSLTLTLTAPNGTPLPGHSATLTVAATHFGTLALVIIGIALGAFLLTSVGRAIRRGTGRPGETGGPGEEAASDDAGNQDEQPESTTSANDSASNGHGTANVSSDPHGHLQDPEEPDEHARAPGRADRR